MSFRKPCHMPFRKLIPPFTLTEDSPIWTITVCSDCTSCDVVYYRAVNSYTTLETPEQANKTVLKLLYK